MWTKRIAVLPRWLCIALVVGVLCAGCDKSGSGGSPQAKWQDRANWKQIRPSMTQDQVRTLLGEPTQVKNGPAFTDWHYGDGEQGGKIIFAGGMVKDWQSPR